MQNQERRALIDRDLEAIPRGEPLQNMYRMAYLQARLYWLQDHTDCPETTEAAHELALMTVRNYDPDFQPTVLTEAP